MRKLPKKKDLKLESMKMKTVEMKTVWGGPTRRAELDHVGAYNFTVEIEGVDASSTVE